MCQRTKACDYHILIVSDMSVKRLYAVILITLIYFIGQLVLCQVTYSLCLLISLYHMLCNLIAFIGCDFTIRYCKKHNKQLIENSRQKMTTTNEPGLEDCNEETIAIDTTALSSKEQYLRTTFGWMRIDVLTMLCVSVVLMTLCFTLFIKAIQTLCNLIDTATLKHPLLLLAAGVIGLLVNVICYLLVGGFTYRQGSFLFVTKNSEFVIDRCDVLPHVPDTKASLPQSKRSITNICRDLSSFTFVVICAAIWLAVGDRYPKIAPYIDPSVAIFSGLTLLGLSSYYIKQSGLILLQTIPSCIDIKLFKSKLLENFEEIKQIHDLHIWMLTARKFVATVHITFQNPMVYLHLMNRLTEFFREEGISHVTIQPEFLDELDIAANKCLIECTAEECLPKKCCQSDSIKSVDSKDSGNDEPKTDEPHIYDENEV